MFSKYVAAVHEPFPEEDTVKSGQFHLYNPESHFTFGNKFDLNLGVICLKIKITRLQI